jgi:hypothetical protein
MAATALETGAGIFVEEAVGAGMARLREEKGVIASANPKSSIYDQLCPKTIQANLNQQKRLYKNLAT